MVVILLGNGFEDIEALAPCDVLRRGGLKVVLAGIGSKDIVSSRGVTVKADCILDELDASDMEQLIIPGGNGGVDSIWSSGEAIALIKNAHERGIPTAAICAGPVILSRLGYLETKQAVCHPSRAAELTCAGYHPDKSTVRDGDIITGRAAGASIDFGFAILTALKGESVACTVAEAMCYDI